MNRLSVRVRLTLWNVGVLALVLLTLGFSVRAIVRAYLIASINTELRERADQFRYGWLPRLRYEKDKFVFVRRSRPGDRGPGDRGPGDRGPGGGQGDRGGDKNGDHRPFPFPSPESGKEHDNPKNDKQEPFPTPSPSPSPSRDTYAPRILAENGEPLFPFFHYSAWDRASIKEAKRAHTPVYSTITSENEPYQLITITFYALPGEDTKASAVPPAFAQFAFRLTDVLRGLSALDRALLTLLPLSLIVAALGGSWLTGRALRPVRDITLATDKIAAESLAGRLPVTGNDEFSELSRRFNGMLERLESSFERQRRFTADASHELRTPLAIVTANVSLALDDEMPPTPEGTKRVLTAIHGAANRMSRIVANLLLLAQSDSGKLPMEHKPVLLYDVLQTSQEEARAAHLQRTKNEGARIVLPEPTDLCIKDADVHYLVRVFVNLLENALRHTPPTGCVTVSLTKERGMVHVIVTDTGSGIAPEHLPRLFDRFYRADAGRDRERGGTGLGLPIVETLISAHNGSVSIASELGKGTSVTVTLPIQS